MKVKFSYTEPMIGEFETDREGLTFEEIIKEIEMSFPEAIDIEIVQTES